MIYVLGCRDNFHSLESSEDLYDYFDGDKNVTDLGVVDVHARDPIERRKFGDMTYWVNAPVFSGNALEVLNGALEDGVEVVPLSCSGEELYALKVSIETQGFDFEKSIFKSFDDGRIFSIDKHVFRSGEGEGKPKIFKIPRSSRHIYVNKSFVDLVNKSGLKGFNFSEIWPCDRYSPLARCESYTMKNLLEKDAEGSLEDDFDSELWFKLVDKIESVSDLDRFPLPVRVYFASRLMQWEVGNGGFAQAAMNIPEWFSQAATAYEILGKPHCAELIRKAQRIAKGDWIKIILAKVSIDKAFSYFREDKFRSLDEKLDEVDWWSDWDRVDYVREHRDDFINI